MKSLLWSAVVCAHYLYRLTSHHVLLVAMTTASLIRAHFYASVCDSAALLTY